MTLIDASETQSDTRTTPVDVSVIIAARNAQEFIDKALHSALGQSDVELEVIVVDDASTDRTAALVEEYARHEPRLRLVRADQHCGPGAARNLALDVARGRWVATLDADDSFQFNRLESLLAVARKHDADIVADNLWLVDGASGVPFSRMLYPGSNGHATIVTAEDFVRNNNPRSIKRKYGLLKPIIRKKFLSDHNIRYDESTFYGEDFLFYLECLIQKARFVLVSEAYYLYNLSSMSITRTRSLRQAAIFLNRCDALLERPEVGSVPGLARALRDRSRQLRYDFVYIRFMRSLKRGHIWEMAKIVAGRPRVAPYILRHMFNISWLRAHQLLARTVISPARRAG